MGFMDKAKKMAEQAQTKLDEAQKQFNTSQGPGQQSGPAVEYDEHGRPVAQAPQGSVAPPVEQAPDATRIPPHGDPLAPEPSPAAPSTPGVPPTGPADPVADAADEDRNKPSYAPPKLSSGDPLAG